MGPIESLIALLCALYLSDCWFLVAPAARVLRSPWLRGWTATESGLRIANSAGAWVLLQPLAPLGRHAVIEPWPLALTPDAAVNRAQPRQLGRETAELAPIGAEAWPRLESEGRRVRLGRREVALASSPRAAERAVRRLRALAGLPRDEREARIEAELRDAFDAAAIERRASEVLRASRPLLLACNALFLYLIAALPAVLATLGLEATWPWLLGGLACFETWVLLAFARAHRELYPESRLERRLQLAQMIFSPPLAVRATDAALRDAFAGFHPLAVERVLVPAAEFATRVAPALRESAAGATRSSLPESVRAVRAAFDARESREIARLAREVGLDPERILAPPSREDDSRGYCPACLTQYLRDDGVCSDCDDVPLCSFRT